MKAIILSPKELHEILWLLASLEKVYRALGHIEDAKAVDAWVDRLSRRARGRK